MTVRYFCDKCECEEDEAMQQVVVDGVWHMLCPKCDGKYNYFLLDLEEKSVEEIRRWFDKEHEDLLESNRRGMI